MSERELSERNNRAGANQYLPNRDSWFIENGEITCGDQYTINFSYKFYKISGYWIPSTLPKFCKLPCKAHRSTNQFYTSLVDAGL